MPRSEEAASFFHAVYSAVQEIPHGRVTTYGHIATLVGTRKSPRISPLMGGRLNDVTAQRPRQVGVCLKHLSEDSEARFNSSNVPWQRVINSKGTLSPRSAARLL